MVAARCGSVDARAAGAGQEPKEAARFGDSAPRGRHAHACENVCVSRTSGWRSWCSAVWRAMADVSVRTVRKGWYGG